MKPALRPQDSGQNISCPGSIRGLLGPWVLRNGSRHAVPVGLLIKAQPGEPTPVTGGPFRAFHLGKEPAKEQMHKGAKRCLLGVKPVQVMKAEGGAEKVLEEVAGILMGVSALSGAQIEGMPKGLVDLLRENRGGTGPTRWSLLGRWRRFGPCFILFRYLPVEREVPFHRHSLRFHIPCPLA